MATGFFLVVKWPERGAGSPGYKCVGDILPRPFCAYIGMSWGDL